MQPSRELLVTIPNLITLARLVLVPSIVWVLSNSEFAAAFWLFVLAGFGDAVDGFLARQLNVVSRLGTFLDPLADKALLVSIYVTLGVLLKIPTWLVIMVVSRDLLIVSGVVLAWLLDKPIELKPLKVSKANTLAQIVYAAVVLFDLGFAWDLSTPSGVLSVVVAALTVSSAAAYLYEWVRHMGRT